MAELAGEPFDKEVTMCEQVLNYLARFVATEAAAAEEKKVGGWCAVFCGKRGMLPAAAAVAAGVEREYCRGEGGRGCEMCGTSCREWQWKEEGKGSGEGRGLRQGWCRLAVEVEKLSD